MSSKIDLLEIGSNNFEMIEFSLERQLPDGSTRTGIYGVNVAKVREVVRLPTINPLASSVKGIEGIFELRGVPIPAINLCQVLGDSPQPLSADLQIIVSEFSMKRAGFIVNQTKCIRRVEWSKVMAPSSGESSFMTGMVLRDDGEFLFILDLEKILAKLEMAASGRDGFMSAGRDQFIPNMDSHSQQAAEKLGTILLVDDSSIIRSNLKTVLSRAGYRVILKEDGEKALHFLEDYANDFKSDERIDIVVTDVEMPRMDGLTLIDRMKKNPLLSSLPVLLHSSLSNPATQEAGLKAGANGYVVKSDPAELIKKIKHFLKAAA